MKPYHGIYSYKLTQEFYEKKALIRGKLEASHWQPSQENSSHQQWKALYKLILKLYLLSSKFKRS